MEVRNAHYINGTDVDCEFFHEGLQKWLPTTVSENDPQQVGIREALSKLDIGAVPSYIADQQAENFALAVKKECKKRILAVVSESDYSNLTAASSAGRLNADQVAAFNDGLDWIKAMRVTCSELITHNVQDCTKDTHWSPVPSSVVELVEAF